MAVLTFSDYAPDGSVEAVLTVDDGPMLLPGAEFTVAGKLANLVPFTATATGPDRLGDFGAPTAAGWTVEVLDEDHAAGVARFRLIPPSG